MERGIDSMPKEAMTSKERYAAVLSGSKPDRTPTFYRATPEFTAILMQHLSCSSHEDLCRRLHIDLTVTLQPRYIGPPIPPDEDIFGIKYENIAYGEGSYREAVSHPLATYTSMEEIEGNYSWPSPDWYDYSVIPAQLKGREDCPVYGGGSEPFLTYCDLRGRQQAFLDLIMYPDIVHYCLDKLFGLAYERTRRIYEAAPGKVDITTVAEDLGSQTSLLMSPAHIHGFLLPRMKRMMELARQAGAKVQCHSDGAIREILPALITAGIDILDPVQWRCPGMDREGLKRDFGHSLIFHGAMDNQYTLAFGSVDEVVQEVRDNLAILGAGGGYILGPCHNIQVISQPENIVAMYETCYREGHSVG
jgi:uroporphyrinogen decarboxylase